MKPKATRNPAMVRGTDGLMRLEMVDAGREVVLDPLAELVWDLSDGSRSCEDLAQAAGQSLDRVVHKEEVFSALDFLADAGLIEERVAPPAAEAEVSRRSLLVQIAPVVGAAAWMMSGASARAGGLFQESNIKEQSSKEPGDKKSEEEARKELDSKLDARIKPLRDKNERHRIWYESHKGRLDRSGKYSVASNHPLVGMWRSVSRSSCYPACEETTLSWTFFPSGIAESRVSGTDFDEQQNWKYTSTGRDAGILETFLGELTGKSNLRWISKNEFELSDSPRRYVRDPHWREGIR